MRRYRFEIRTYRSLPSCIDEHTGKPKCRPINESYFTALLNVAERSVHLRGFSGGELFFDNDRC